MTVSMKVLYEGFKYKHTSKVAHTFPINARRNEFDTTSSTTVPYQDHGNMVNKGR